MKKEFIIGCIIFFGIIIVYDYVFINGIKNYELTQYDRPYEIKIRTFEKQRPTILINNKYMVRNPRLDNSGVYLLDILEVGDSIFIPKEVDSIYLYRGGNLFVNNHYYRSK